MKEYELHCEWNGEKWIVKRRREVKHIIPKTREYTHKGKKHKMPVGDSYEPIGEWEDVE